METDNKNIQSTKQHSIGLLLLIIVFIWTIILIFSYSPIYKLIVRNLQERYPVKIDKFGYPTRGQEYMHAVAVYLDPGYLGVVYFSISFVLFIILIIGLRTYLHEILKSRKGLSSIQRFGIYFVSIGFVTSLWISAIHYMPSQTMDDESLIIGLPFWIFRLFIGIPLTILGVLLLIFGFIIGKRGGKNHQTGSNIIH